MTDNQLAGYFSYLDKLKGTSNNCSSWESRRSLG
jgi:hypothetical protein